MNAAKQIQMYPVVNSIQMPSSAPIPGGFIIKARKIEESEIAHAAPSIREVWDWILMQCNHKDNLTLNIRRGQCVRKLSDIQEGLHWFVGYRKETYSKTQCEHALEWLRKRGMITTTKTTRGLLITVCKYDSYNTIDNYEYNAESNKKTTRRQQHGDTINKNDKNVKNDKESEGETPKLTPTQFYAEQIEANVEHELIEKYKALVEYLKGKNDEDLTFKNVLALEQQLTFNQYLKLREKWQNGSVDLRDILKAMENDKKAIKDKKSMYVTIDGWANIRKDRSYTKSKR